MSTADRKERAKLELKDLILEASKRILLNEGKEKLSIRKIAADIEYSPATIYLYFNDKDAILHELMERGFEHLSEYMVESWLEPDPGRKLYKIGVSYVKFALEHKDWYDLMFNSSSPMKHLEKCKEDWDKGFVLFSSLVSICKEYIVTSNRQELDPEILALQLWSSVHGLINLAQTERLDIVRQGDKINLINQTLESIYLSILNHKD